MKTSVFGLAIALVVFTACGNVANQSKKGETASTDNPATDTLTSKVPAQQASTITEPWNAYLQIKNALANDDGQGAAAGGKAFIAAMDKVDKSAMIPEQKQALEEVADDAKEMAEHIGKSADRIEHQREHFDMLSQDMYDLVKAFGTGQTVYKDFCPMYNNNKGASWLSETKKIKNPYLGRKMPDCGEVKEEIKR